MVQSTSVTCDSYCYLCIPGKGTAKEITYPSTTLCSSTFSAYFSQRTTRYTCIFDVPNKSSQIHYLFSRSEHFLLFRHAVWNWDFLDINCSYAHIMLFSIHSVFTVAFVSTAVGMECGMVSTSNSRLHWGAEYEQASCAALSCQTFILFRCKLKAVSHLLLCVFL